MKSLAPLKLFTALVLGATLTPFVLAAEPEGHDHDKGSHVASGSLIKADSVGVSAEWVAKAKAGYPLTTCVVSGEKLEGGDMGGAQDYVFRREGQPDRLVRFCCHDCVKDFSGDPEKFLLEIDAAAKAKPAPGK